MTTKKKTKPPTEQRVTIPHALAESAARVERDLLACGVDRLRAQSAKARVLALGMMAAKPTTKAPPFNPKDPRVRSLARQLRSAGALSEKAIGSALLAAWRRYHGA